MGQISKGILGGFSGQVGSVIGSSWKGINYMRSVPLRKKSRTFSQSQLEQQEKFSTMLKFVKNLKDIVAVTFKSLASGMSGSNKAMSYNLANAITGSYPNYFINYGTVLISKGNLPPAGNVAVTTGGSGKITFSWNDNSGLGKALPTDKAILVAYSPDLDTVVYTLTGPMRSATFATLAVEYLSGKQVHTWLAFISDDGKSVSNSAYSGMITVD